MKLQNKVALVTGASRGVGRATVRQLAQEGCSVMINYWQSEAAANETRQKIEEDGGRAALFQADVSDEKAYSKMIDSVIEQFGRLDILINNAATTEFLPFDDLDRLTDAHWDRLFSVNVKGAFYCARAAKPHLQSVPEGGRIVNVSSIAGIIGMGSSIAYCASKAALINMTQSLARALGPTVQVNSIAPGFIEDDWTRIGLGDQYEGVKATNTERALLKRVCQPEDVAAAIVGLVTGSAMITGQTLICDGGTVLK